MNMIFFSAQMPERDTSSQLKSPHSSSVKAMTSDLGNNDIEAIVLSKNKKKPMGGGKDDPTKAHGEKRES